MSNRTQPKIRVAIIGGGPGGLALAATIAKFNDPTAPVAIDLYESQPEIGTIGAGISVWPRTRALLEILGLIDSLQGELGVDETNKAPMGFTFRKSDQPDGYEHYKLNMPRSSIFIHRSALITTLQAGLPPPPLCTVHTSSRLISYSYSTPGDTNSSVILHFADGSIREADVVVGADGVRSAVRGSMFPGGKYVDERGREHIIEPKWTGVVAYRSLVTRKSLEAIGGGEHHALVEPQVACGIDKHIVTYPISRGELINLVAFVTTPGGYGTRYNGKWVRDTTPEEVRACYEGWELEAHDILKCIGQVSAWAIHILEDTPRCAIGRAAILGDALHAMETHFGAGAGQAMEDAYVLGRLLTHRVTTRSNLTAALAAYEKSRLEFSTSVVTSTRRVGKVYEFSEGPLPPSQRVQGSEDDWGQRWGKEVQDAWKFQFYGDANEFWSVAEAHLLISGVRSSL